MATVAIDARGMRCPLPIQQLIMHMHETASGDIIEITATCPTFEEDVRNWAKRAGKTLLAITHDGDATVA